jgi:large subunit ribosomal protein L18
MAQYSGRTRRRKHIRKRIIGTTERPRLTVKRSLNNLNAQFIDDIDGRTLLGLSTFSPKLKENKDLVKGNIKQATAFASIVAEEAKKKGIKKVIFDRAGYLYHGRIKAFADAARKAGLEF